MLSISLMPTYFVCLPYGKVIVPKSLSLSLSLFFPLFSTLFYSSFSISYSSISCSSLSMYCVCTAHVSPLLIFLASTILCAVSIYTCIVHPYWMGLWWHCTLIWRNEKKTNQSEMCAFLVCTPLFRAKPCQRKQTNLPIVQSRVSPADGTLHLCKVL
jgi:hypothetical protein